MSPDYDFSEWHRQRSKDFTTDDNGYFYFIMFLLIIFIVFWCALCVYPTDYWGVQPAPTYTNPHPTSLKHHKKKIIREIEVEV